MPCVSLSLHCLIASTTQAQTAAIVGSAHAADGDSLIINDTRIRLYGIDAPELDQQCQRNGVHWACGEDAKTALQDMVADRPVTCIPHSTDKHSRVVAICSDQYGEINVAMVELGWATAYSFHTDRYEAAQASAKAARKGIWDGRFTNPRDYRVIERRIRPRQHAARTGETETREGIRQQ